MLLASMPNGLPCTPLAGIHQPGICIADGPESQNMWLVTSVCVENKMNHMSHINTIAKSAKSFRNVPMCQQIENGGIQLCFHLSHSCLSLKGCLTKIMASG